MKRIEIKNFKAFNDTSVVLGDLSLSEHKNILCYGENGSGKTSIYEAIKYFFFKERIINEKVSSSKVGEERNAEIRQIEIDYRHRSTMQEDIFIEVDKKNSKNFNFNEQEVYMVSSKDLQVSSEIDILEILNACYLTRNTIGKDGCVELIIGEVNRLLSTYFYSNIEIQSSQNSGNKIVIKDNIRQLELDRFLNDYFNESIIHLIKLLLILSSVSLLQDRKKISLLVFDDIVTSIDNSYRSFLYRYIQNEFKDFQIIILTHSTSFFNLCEHWINENGKSDKWVIQGIYEYEGKHKIYTKGRLSTENIKEKLKTNNIDIMTLGNETRQLFEMLIQQFCMLTMIGAKEETDKLISEISKNEQNGSFCVTEQDIQTSTDLLKSIRNLLNNCPVDQQLNKIKQEIITFDNKRTNRLSSWLDEMKMYQKSTLHQTSHGHTGLPDISSSEIKASLQVLSQLESAIKKIKIGRIQV